MADNKESEVYHWIDNEGVMYYGDRVPPRFAATGHIVLTEQGIEINRIDREKTAEEKAVQQRLAQLLAENNKVRDAAILRDKVLLSTYLSINEIEALRDRRTELVAGQIRITQIYLDNLREKLLKLEKEAQHFRPYSTKQNTRPIDEKLARELSNTLNSIMLYEQNLARSILEQNQLMAKFSSDIDRFKELHTLN
ncbi:MAG: hypothetical protein GY727_07400 [Gammaproteobacteria bacterium]|nr:hypothetical protein [Gammaproteobacteria bacterium]MCP4091698.1 hypothetical protein [Gammaproteobacteria bacterium]MCP4275005.1 hypothetical protein [Gammaproteobacteria bacterium]MCP4831828.1 hypothetical protein [Gammaproteobacteria bacterium]MCP4929764.1 hypothetical protein [Gammaproteobacteria bacterium]